MGIVGQGLKSENEIYYFGGVGVKRPKKIGAVDARYGIYIQQHDNGRWSFHIGTGGLMGCGAGYESEEEVRARAKEAAERLQTAINKRYESMARLLKEADTK